MLLKFFRIGNFALVMPSVSRRRGVFTSAEGRQSTFPYEELALTVSDSTTTSVTAPSSPL